MMTAIELKELIEPILLTYTLRGFDIRQIRTQGIPNIGRRLGTYIGTGQLFPPGLDIFLIFPLTSSLSCCILNT